MTRIKTDPKQSQSQRIEKESLFISTMVALAKAGDFLMTVEDSLEKIKRSSADDFLRTFGATGKPSRRVLKSHLRRFEQDMARMLRYSCVVFLYTLFETTARRLVAHLAHLYPQEPSLRQFEQNKNRRKLGFVRNLQTWLEARPRPIKLGCAKFWDKLDDIRVIRNCIAHANGEEELTADKEPLESAVQRTEGVQFDDSRTLSLEIAFPVAVLDILTRFFQLVFREAGYHERFPPGHLEAMAKSFAGFQSEIADAIKAYDARLTT